MRVSVVAGLIIGVHVVVIGSVALQGCVNTQGSAGSTRVMDVESSPVPVMPPTATIVQPSTPVTFPVAPAPAVASATAAPSTGAASNIHEVKKGDTLSGIAKQYGVTTKELLERNNIANKDRIKVGQKILLPDYAKAGAAAAVASPTKKPTPAPATPVVAEAGTYIVKKGDALSKIAVAHGVKTKDLAEANKISSPDKIFVGQKLKIPGGAAAAVKPAADEKAAAIPPPPAPLTETKTTVTTSPSGATTWTFDTTPAPAAATAPSISFDDEELLPYTVQEGDTIAAIARLFVVGQEDIRRVNNLSADQEVAPGVTIKIPPTNL